VIIDEDAQAIMVITQKRISSRRSSDFQSMAGSGEGKRQNSYRLERPGMLGKSTVMSNHRHVKTQRQRGGTCIAKAAPGDNGDSDSELSGLFQSFAIAFRNLTTRVKQSSVEIQGKQTYRHKFGKAKLKESR
jgi:hypothetical protein